MIYYIIYYIIYKNYTTPNNFNTLKHYTTNTITPNNFTTPFHTTEDITLAKDLHTPNFKLKFVKFKKIVDISVCHVG